MRRDFYVILSSSLSLLSSATALHRGVLCTWRACAKRKRAKYFLQYRDYIRRSVFRFPGSSGSDICSACASRAPISTTQASLFSRSFLIFCILTFFHEYLIFRFIFPLFPTLSPSLVDFDNFVEPGHPSYPGRLIKKIHCATRCDTEHNGD